MSQNETQPSAPSSSAPSSSPQLDQSFYNWSGFFSILSGQASPAERRKYFEEKDTLHEESDIKRCETYRDQLFQSSPIIIFLREEIQKMGGDINSWNVRCRRCTTNQGGGMDQNYGILICANAMRSKGHLEDTLAHEMVHAYDHLRFKVDRYNLRHQACTEIRASTLSGECRFTREFFTRNQWKITSQLQECVRRRATLSMMNRPEVKDDVHAARVVNEVWDSCFTDTRPFDEIFR